MVFFHEKFQRRLRAIPIVVLLAQVGCNGGEGPRPPRVSITSPTTVMVGDAIQLTASVQGVDNATQAWGVSSNFLVAQLIASNELYGVGAGAAVVTVGVYTTASDGTMTTVAQDSVTVTVVSPPPSNRPAFLQISSGESSTCALSADGSTFCWGNTSGYRAFAPRCESYYIHLGGPRLCHSVPVKLQGFPQFEYVNGGTYSTCAVTTLGDAFCWGIGPYNTGNTSGDPAIVPGGIQFTSVSVETGFPMNPGSEVEHVCGITPSKALYCWRRGGSPTSPSVMPGSNYTAVSLGGISGPSGSDRYRGCALDTSGVAYCWGTAPLGDGNPAPSSEQTIPVAVGGPLRFSAIASDAYSTCALSTDGAPYCWGGLPMTPVLSPTAIPTSLRFTAISGAERRFCAIAADQSAYCWTEDELQSHPTRVQGAFHFQSISVGGPVTCGLTVEGPEVCWGGKGLGDIGDGMIEAVTVAMPTPVAGQRIRP